MSEAPVRVAAFVSPAEAHVARARLEDAGIGARVLFENHVTVDWLMSRALGGVPVVVAGPDAGEALQVLGSPAVALEGDPLSEAERLARKSLYAVVLGAYVPPVLIWAGWLLLKARPASGTSPMSRRWTFWGTCAWVAAVVPWASAVAFW